MAVSRKVTGPILSINDCNRRTTIVPPRQHVQAQGVTVDLNTDTEQTVKSVCKWVKKNEVPFSGKRGNAYLKAKLETQTN